MSRADNVGQLKVDNGGEDYDNNNNNNDNNNGDDDSLALPDADDCVYGDLFDDSDFSFDDDDEDDGNSNNSCSNDDGNGNGEGQHNANANANELYCSFDNIDGPVMDGRMSPKRKSAGTGIGTAHTGENVAMEMPMAVEEYILGTLIVRVAAARDLKAMSRGQKAKSSPSNAITRRNIFRGAYANQPTSSPYAKISFGNQVQRTSTVYDTINPSWPRSDQSYFDVSLPVPNLTQENVDNRNHEEEQNQKLKLKQKQKQAQHSKSHIPLPPPPPKPILTVSIFHTDSDAATVVKKPTAGGGYGKGYESNDEFLGLASIDVTPVLTGKTPCMDQWLSLGGTDDDIVSANRTNNGKSMNNNNNNHNNRRHSSVRLIVEYEAAETPPRQGDLVRFTGFVNPLDLFPLPNSHIFKVEEVRGGIGMSMGMGIHNNSGGASGTGDGNLNYLQEEDEVVLSYYTSAENWKCTFQVHRYMLISVERHVTALERYQEDLLELSEKLAHSPAAEVVSNTMNNLSEEGILVVGLQAAVGSISLMGRWMNGGIGTAIDDIVYATNLDGKHTSSHDMGMDGSMNIIGLTTTATTGREDGDISMSSSISASDASAVPSNAYEYDEDNMSYTTDDDASATTGDANMPCCPISGLPMKDPVVAADGHTYERKSILRWFRDSDISPLTGTKLLHKELAPNFLLISTFSGSGAGGGKYSEESSQITQC